MEPRCRCIRWEEHRRLVRVIALTASCKPGPVIKRSCACKRAQRVALDKHGSGCDQALTRLGARRLARVTSAALSHDPGFLITL